MGQLTFSKAIALTPNVQSVSIVNLPDDTVQQVYWDNNAAYKREAHLTVAKDYDALVFSAAAPLPYDNVVASSIKSFPQYGSYGFITQEDATRHSTLILNF